MCNAYNHSPGCNCGWGGGNNGGWSASWRRGLGGGFGGSGDDNIHIDCRSFMQQLAADLGYSIVFPTLCRYCGEPIYLYAAPNGGFAIFDHLGPPWPKHQCWGIGPSPTRYVLLDTRAVGRISIPNSAPVARWRPGRSIEGIVARATPASKTIDIYTGRVVMEGVPVSGRLPPEGRYARSVTEDQMGAVVFEVVELPHNLATVVGGGQGGGVSAEVEGQDARLHGYRLDRATLASANTSSAATLLDGLIQASSGGHLLAELILLVELVSLNDASTDTEMRARHALDAFDLARKLGFDGLPSAMESRLSNGVRKKLASLESDDGVRSGIRSLQAKFHVKDSSRSRYRKLHRHERAFLDALCAKLGGLDARIMTRRFEQKLDQEARRPPGR